MSTLLKSDDYENKNTLNNNSKIYDANQQEKPIIVQEKKENYGLPLSQSFMEEEKKYYDEKIEFLTNKLEEINNTYSETLNKEKEKTNDTKNYRN